MYGRILVPIDGSEPSVQGLEEAIKLARQLNAGIRLVHVLDEGPPAPAEALGIDMREREARRVAADTLLTEAVARVSRAGVDVDRVLVEAEGGPAGQYIVEKAGDCRADLIVCGTHGRRGIRRVLMGSDAEYIVRHANVPVLLVRSRKAESQE